MQNTIGIVWMKIQICLQTKKVFSIEANKVVLLLKCFYISASHTPRQTLSQEPNMKNMPKLRIDEKY